jgi:hypothetical protein
VTDGNSGSNYHVTFVNASGSIGQAAITVTADAKTKTFGTADPPLTYNVTSGSLVAGDSFTGSLSRVAGETVAGSPYAIQPGTLSAGPNYHLTFVPANLTITPREGRVAYIGQTVFYTSGSSSTTTQATLSASVSDVDGSGLVSNATVTFTDLLSNKVLASGVKVAPVQNGDGTTGTANTIVTLSTGQYGAQEYLIEVKLTGNYKNTQQLDHDHGGTAQLGSTEYNAAHPQVTAMIPATANSTQGGVTLPKLATAAGKYGDATVASYTMGLKYNKGGSSPQGQVQLVLTRWDGTYYIKSNSITSLGFAPIPTGSKAPKDVTIYTKASIYKVAANGTLTSIDGNVSLRVDAHEGCVNAPCDSSTGDQIGFTVLSSKDSSLYYSNNWVYASDTKSWRTVMQDVTGPNGSAVVIN